ncbi:RidA family protein [Emcibacter nanhaiensis]|uniref:RidA family protein n=1 Tax=Emcibacter nanhaiensis TaxID=1505037 RepID=A0A501PJC8_9PROT|nr:RidA family protein [Emcibacter nanhaiensis]TPD60227.1 RidA family protein [Emcibacter nanhaiensis]
MSREIINPDSMYETVQYGFSHAAASTATKTIHCAGQVAWDKDYSLVGEGDLAAQCEQVFKNLTEVLAASGATAANVVRMRTYVVDYSPDKLEAIGPAIAAFYGNNLPAANTVLGVAALAMPGFLLEVEVTAMTDG